MKKEIKFSLVFRDMWQSAGNLLLAGNLNFNGTAACCCFNFLLFQLFLSFLHLTLHFLCLLH